MRLVLENAVSYISRTSIDLSSSLSPRHLRCRETRPFGPKDGIDELTSLLIAEIHVRLQVVSHHVVTCLAGHFHLLTKNIVWVNELLGWSGAARGGSGSTHKMHIRTKDPRVQHAAT